MPPPPPAAAAATAVKSPPIKIEQEIEVEAERDKCHDEQDDSDNEEDFACSLAKMTLAIQPLRLEAGTQSKMKVTSALMLSPLQQTLWEAREAGEDIAGFLLYHVVERPNPTNPEQIL